MDEPVGASGAANVASPASADPGQPGGPPLVLYDGWCNLCDSSVAFLLRLDRRAVFRFAPLQSQPAAAALGRCGANVIPETTMVLVADGRCLTRSEAVLAILARLPAPWRWLAALRAIPPRAPDSVYDLIARRRLRWFGRRQVCRTSMAAYRDRFLES